MERAGAVGSSAADLPDRGARLIEVHRLMCLVRALDERMQLLVLQGKAAFVGSCAGQEGVQVAATMAMGENDLVIPYYRDLGVAVAMGLTALEWMLAVYARKDDPLSGGRQIPGHFSCRQKRIVNISTVVGAHLSHAVGVAYASRLRGLDQVSLCLFGDGATSTGDFHEALNMAAVHRLPVVFVCENNGWAISVPQDRQMAVGDVALRASGYGMPGLVLPGSDVPGLYENTLQAVARARRQEGPTLIEAKCPRLNSHSSEDDQRRYRSIEDEQAARRSDPLVHFEAWLEARGWLTAEQATQVRQEAAALALQAAEAAEMSDQPDAADLGLHVYAQA